MISRYGRAKPAFLDAFNASAHLFHFVSFDVPVSRHSRGASSGELIGGSQREERLEQLEEKMVEFDLSPKDYWWYNDLRRYDVLVLFVAARPKSSWRFIRVPLEDLTRSHLFSTPIAFHLCPVPGVRCVDAEDITLSADLRRKGRLMPMLAGYTAIGDEVCMPLGSHAMLTRAFAIDLRRTECDARGWCVKPGKTGNAVRLFAIGCSGCTVFATAAPT